MANSQILKHSKDCRWREKKGVRHSDAGYGECQCDCHYENLGDRFEY